jgi:cysteine desulfurase
MLSISGHKFYGPKGVGALYIKSGVKVWAHALGGEQERGLRGGTLNVPAIVGLAAAYAKNHATMYATNEKLQTLRALFLKELSSLGGVIVNGENTLPAIINLRFAGVSNVDILYNLDLCGVSAAAGSACASSSIQPSHVLSAMGLTDKEANECVRFSLGKNTTEEEVRRAAAIVRETVEKLRKCV